LVATEPLLSGSSFVATINSGIAVTKHTYQNRAICVRKIASSLVWHRLNGGRLYGRRNRVQLKT
jgi:hypothetical protein